MEKDNHKWIFPPALRICMLQFKSLYESLYKVADRRKPLMIVGERGVGKSAFVELFVNLFKTDNLGKKIKRINIASFPETLLVSELFGHVRGAFTGADKSKDGHLTTLGDGGLLILEEIGDISKETQAKLLTVIEDGEYYALGETSKVTKAKNIQIIGTTNKLRTDFREDFYDRFFRFRIPSIHQRREDILYYLGFYYPELLNQLTPGEVLCLIGYSWPGNVREIENACDQIKWRQRIILDSSQGENNPIIMPLVGGMLNPKSNPLPHKVAFESREQVSKYFTQWEILKRRLTLTGIENDLDLERYVNWVFEVNEAKLEEFQKKLKKFCMTIGLWNNKAIYANSYFNQIPRQFKLPEDVPASIQSGENISAFNHAWSGFLEFCRITRQIPTANRDLLHVPDHLREKGVTSHENNLDMFSMTEDNLLRTYYNGLLQRSKNKAEAARKAGLARSTFDDAIKKYGLP